MAVWLWILLTLLGVAHVVEAACPAVTDVTIAIKTPDPDGCAAALTGAGACAAKVKLINNSPTATRRVGYQLMLTQGGTDATRTDITPIPPSITPGPDDSGITLAPGAVYSVDYNFHFYPTTIAAGISGSVYNDALDPDCGDAQQRRSRVVDSHGQYFLNPNLLNVVAQQQPRRYVYRINCVSPQWANTGGTCSASATCWKHDQLFTRDLSPREAAAWGALNCCSTCGRPQTTPLGTDADGPYGDDLPACAGGCTF